MSQHGNYKKEIELINKRILICEVKKRSLIDKLLGRNKPIPVLGLACWDFQVIYDKDEIIVVSCYDHKNGEYSLVLRKKEG